MKIARRFYIACEHCGREFGGPTGGEYEPEEYGGIDGLVAYLAAEAIDLVGWIGIRWHNADVLVCSPGCAADWMNDFLKEGN